MVGKMLFFVLLITFTLCQVDPPVWPQVFQQSFVESYNTSSQYTSGKLSYDWKNGFSRVDLTNGRNDMICGSILPDVEGPCTHLVREKKRYIVHPQKRMCCMCCDEAHGCGVLPRNWLSSAKYVGEESISGQSFYKWSITFGPITDYYYATKTEQRIPRKILDNGNRKVEDFIMNTYSIQPIPQSVFALPEYCKATCPATTICGKIQSENQ